MRVARSDTAASLAWVDGRLAFDNAEVRDVAADLGRWFDVDIRVATTALAHRRLSAVYNNPSLDGVLNAVVMTLGARYQRTGRTITLSPRGR
jgi:transmembrane sensor